MKKSKFLKKSLAMLLAIMMVVAMIPLSASAVEQPVVTVNGVAADLSGNTFTAEVNSTEDVILSGVVNPGLNLVFYDKDGNEITKGTGINLADEATVSGNTYTLNVEIQSTQDDDDAPVEEGSYTLVITLKQVAPDNDTTLKAVVNVAQMAYYTIDNAANEITIVMPFGVAAPTLAYTNFTATSDAEETNVSYSSGDPATVTVTAQSGATRTYTVKVENETGFGSFTVAGQTGDSEITNNGATPAVAIKMPYGTDFEEKIVPTFTVGDTVTKVTTTENEEEIEVVSGTTALTFNDGTAKPLKVYTDTNEEGVPVDVTLTSQENTAAVLEKLKVGSANEVEVSGTAVSVELPAGTKLDEQTSVNVTGTASANATVSIPAQTGKTVTLSDGATAFTLTGVNISGGSFVIRVAAAEGDAYTDYNVTVGVASSVEANLNDFSVKYQKTGEDEVTYTATNGTLTLPYSAQATGELTNYKIYAQASTGATITVSGIAGSLTNGAAFSGVSVTNNEFTVTVENNRDGQTVKNTYTIKLAYEAAKTGRTISSAEATSENTVSKMSDDNTYSVTVGTMTNSVDNKSVRTLRVNVPYSFTDDANVYLSELTMSEGAVAYVANASGDLTKIETLDLAGYGVQSKTQIPVSTNAVEDGKLVVASATAVYVVSEKNSLTTYSNVSGLPANAYTTYYVYGVKAAAQTGHSLNSLSATYTDDTTYKTYEVSSQITSTGLTITIPNSMPTDEAFYLDLNASSQATITAGDVTLPKEYDADVAGPVEGMARIGDDYGLEVYDESESTWDDVSSIVVTNEAGNASSNYAVTVKRADAETGAALNSVTVNGIRASISGLNVTVALPYGTRLNPITLGIEASDMATINIGNATTYYNPDATYDLNNDITIIVTSEDTKTVRTYTLKAVVAEQFSDVDTSDWYYNNVMRAVELGILSGYSDGTFKPMNNITRRDFAIMLAQSLGHDNDEEATSPFKDVADTDYGVSSIAYLYENEITVGDSNGNFNPDANITRQEAAIMLVKAFEATGTSSDLYADDAQIASWAKSFVYTAKAAGLMKGDDHNEFNPTDRLTRAEAASAMVNAVDN